MRFDHKQANKRWTCVKWLNVVLMMLWAEDNSGDDSKGSRQA